MNIKMMKVRLASIIVAIAACVVHADTETVGDYTWTYEIYYESTGAIAAITGKVAISPKPTGAVTIPSTLGGYPVTIIDNEAFFGCSGMTEVTIPEGVREIGVYAFQGCSSLTRVIIPDSVKSIYGFAFYKCSSLVSVSLPYSLQGVVNESDVFRDASSNLIVSYREPLTKTVVFDASGGVVGEIERLVVEKGMVGELPIPTREHCLFVGWFSESDGGTEMSPDSVVTDDVTYYAHWEFIPQSVNGYLWKGIIGADGLTLTNCSPKTSGAVVIPPRIKGIAVKKLGGKIFSQNVEAVETFVIQDGITCLEDNTFEFPLRTSGVVLKNVYMPPSVTRIGAHALRCFEGATLHWTVGIEPLSINTYFGFGNFFGNLDVTALGGVPDGMVKYGQYGWDNNSMGGRTTFRCKQAYYSEWRNFFGNSATFLGYIDDEYSYCPPVCEMMFNPNGGVVSEYSRVVVSGSTPKDLPIPTPPSDGYAFTGWWTAADGGERVDHVTVVDADMICYAHWAPGFNVTFDANGGHVGETQRSVQQNEAIGALPYPSRHGYNFEGWFTAPVGGALVSTKTVVIGNVTYFAHWSISPYEWAYTGDASSGLMITGVSPRPIGFVEIPAVLDNMTVVKLDLRDFTNNLPVETSFVVPNGVTEIGDRTFLLYYTDNAKEIYLPPSLVSWGTYSVNLNRNQTMHWTIGDQAVSFVPSYGSTSSIGTIWGSMDYIAVGGVPSGLKTFLDKQMKTPTITYRCKRAYKDGWDAFFTNVGKTATFLGYIDDDYEYLDPILTISAGVLESVQLMGGRDVVIPDGVTEISANAFAGNTLLRSVTIPASVTTIATGAFSGCTGLECVSIPYSLDAVIATAFPNGVGGVEVVFTDDDMATGGDAGWGTDTATVHGGIVSRKSGMIGNNQATWIEMRTENPGRLSFWWKASSESDEDLVFDYAYLSIDGVPQGTLLTANEEYELDGIAIGGKTGWQQVVLNVTGSGVHTIRWTYCKDEVDEGDTGEDCVWLDDVVFTPLVSATFNLGGGTGTTPAGFSESAGTVVTLPGQDGFSRTDYLFNGWSDGATLYAAGAQYTMPYADVTLTAQWTKKTFLTFLLGGGTGTTPAVVKELRGTVITLPGQSGFDRTDYAFNGWSDGTTLYAAGAQYTMPSDDVTLTAQWIAKRFLTFTLDGGEGATPVTIKDVPGTTVTLPSADGIAKPKYTFVGWSDGESTYLAGADYTITESGVEFTAVWQRNELSVSISSGNVQNGGTISTQGATISMAAWSDPSDGTPAIHYTLDGSTPTTNSTLYAAPFFADGLGEVSVKAIAMMDNYFDSEVETFTFTRLPYSPAECIGVPNESVTLGGNAQWFRVTGEAAHNGVAALRSGAIGDGENTYVEMTVDRPGEISFWWKVSSQNKVRTNKHDYLSFSIDGMDASTLGGGLLDWTNETFTITGEGTHTLRWIYWKDSDGNSANEDCGWIDDVAWTPEPRRFALVFDANGGVVSENEREVLEGATVGELPIPVREHYTFDGWFTAAEGGDAVTSETVVTGPATYYVHWTADEYMVTFDANGGSLNANTYSVAYGTQIGTLPRPSRSYHVFDGWFTAAEGGDQITAETVVMGAVTYYAHWTKKTCEFDIVNGVLRGVTPNGEIDVVIPDGVTSIAIRAFGTGCSSIQSVTIPSSVTNVDAEAFYGCSSKLKRVNITDFAAWCRISFANQGATPFQYATGLYLNGELVEDLAIPDGVTNVGNYVFSGFDWVKSITIPNSVTNIGTMAFHYCTNITSLTIPKSVTTIGSSAFSAFIRLENITLPFAGSTRGNYGTADSLFGHVFDTTRRTGCAAVSQNYGSGSKTYYIPSTLKSVTVTDETVLGYGVFGGCSGVKSVTIGNGVTSVGTRAFYSCRGLTGMTIPDTVTNLADSAFAGCSALVEASLPGRLKGVINESSVFANCNAGLVVTYRAVVNEFSAGDNVGVGDSVTLTSAQATWLNGFADYGMVRSVVAAMDADTFEEAYLLNLDVTDGGRGYAFEVTDCDATGENVVVTVRLERTGAVQKSGGGDAPINGVLRLAGSATPASDGFAPIAAATVSDATFANGCTATITFGKSESIRFFKACIVSQ